jgi:hypothetical protein
MDKLLFSVATVALPAKLEVTDASSFGYLMTDDRKRACLLLNWYLSWFWLVILFQRTDTSLNYSLENANAIDTLNTKC